MIIRFENLKKSLAEKIMPVYLIEGEDAFFRARAAEYIKNAALQEPDLNLSRYEGGFVKSDPDKIVLDLRSFPFMSEYRVVEVSDWQPTASELKGDLKKYLSEPNGQSVLIIVNSGKCESLKKFDSVCVVDCGKADIRLIISYIRHKATAARLIINDTTCKKIAEYCLLDMAKIDKETDKLIDYCNGKAEIDERAVEDIVVKDADYKIYEIVSFIAQKNYNKAYEVLKDVTAPAEKQQIFVSLYYHFRRMFYASVYKGDSAALAAYLGDSPYPVKKAKEQSAYFSAKRLKDIVERLAKADGDFKSGKLSLDNAYDLAIFDILSGENR